MGEMMKEREQESCDNCLYEYTCSWEPAGEKNCCGNYKEE